MAGKAKPAELTPAQEGAIGALVEGQPLGDVAGVAGVSVAVLVEWLQTDARFIAAMNVRRQAEYDQQAQRARALVTQALDTLAETMDGYGGVERKHKLQAAALVLRAAGLVELGRPEGETNPKVIEGKQVRDELMVGLV